MCGNICWAYFSGCLNSCGNTFIGNAGILGKVYFPRLVMPISVIFSQLINFIIQFTMLIIFIAYFIIAGTTDLKITVNIIMLPILVCRWDFWEWDLESLYRHLRQSIEIW